jgi:hypothetical protein
VVVYFENGHELYGFVRSGDFFVLTGGGSADFSRRVVLHRIGELVKTEKVILSLFPVIEVLFSSIFVK